MAMQFSYVKIISWSYPHIRAYCICLLERKTAVVYFGMMLHVFIEYFWNRTAYLHLFSSWTGLDFKATLVRDLFRSVVPTRGSQDQVYAVLFCLSQCLAQLRLLIHSILEWPWNPVKTWPSVTCHVRLSSQHLLKAGLAWFLTQSGLSLPGLHGPVADTFPCRYHPVREL